MAHIPDQALFYTCGRRECLDMHRSDISGVDIACNIASAQSWYLLWQYIHLVIDPIPSSAVNSSESQETIYPREEAPGIDFRYLHSTPDGHCRMRSLWNILQHLPASLKASKYYL